jgi:predicted metal-dependent hydrolase
MQAIVIWNEELFFEVHERLETIWQKTSGEERQAFKGIIKAAAAYVHLEQGNRRAARSLADKATRLLVHYGADVSDRLDSRDLVKKLEILDSAPPKLNLPI